MNFERTLGRISIDQLGSLYKGRKTYMIDRTSSTVKGHQTADNDETEEITKKTIPECFVR
jgi:hypothetical protein